MGGLIFILFFFPLTIILLLIWLFTRKKIFAQLIAIMWVGIIRLYLALSVLSFFWKKKEVEHSDICGEYIIDRKQFPGIQADWQYNHYSFEITKQNKFLFYCRNKDKIIKTYKGKVEFVTGYNSPRLIIHVDTPKHHVIEEKPTLYREVWNFYYVFKSPKYGNMFFSKGHWKPIDK
jgi:hypothetical protein